MENNKSKWLIVSSILLIVGALNWGLVGLFNYDIVAKMFSSAPIIGKATYGLIALAAIPAAIELGHNL